MPDQWHRIGRACLLPESTDSDSAPVPDLVWVGCEPLDAGRGARWVGTLIQTIVDLRVILGWRSP